MITENDWSATLQVVRNFKEYGSYGGSPKKAVKALTKRCPGLTIDDAQAAFDACLALLTTAIDTVERHKEEIWSTYSTGNHAAPDMVIPELQASHPDLPEYLYRWIIGWVWFWHHLK